MSLRELGISPEDAAFVGDGGSSELSGARKVGLVTVMITGIIKELWPEKVESRKADADYVIEQPAELLGWDTGKHSNGRQRSGWRRPLMRSAMP